MRVKDLFIFKLYYRPEQSFEIVDFSVVTGQGNSVICSTVGHEPRCLRDNRQQYIVTLSNEVRVSTKRFVPNTMANP